LSDLRLSSTMWLSTSIRARKFGRGFTSYVKFVRSPASRSLVRKKFCQ
jgi:hypothetical protein